jgi:propionyl-CoA carboxylase beta chain
MTDFILMVKDTSYMFVTGPEVVRTVTNEVVTAEELGGALTHTRKSSVADAAFENDVEAIAEARRLSTSCPLEPLAPSPRAPSSTTPRAWSPRSTPWSPRTRTPPTTCASSS